MPVGFRYRGRLDGITIYRHKGKLFENGTSVSGVTIGPNTYLVTEEKFNQLLNNPVDDIDGPIPIERFVD